MKIETMIQIRGQIKYAVSRRRNCEVS